ncbi:Ig-like domain-containing protein [Pediococcus acidilactici]
MNKNPKNHKGVVDSKVSNFKMYKVNKHWVFASALMLSMLGAGMMQTDTAAHADSTNEPQVEMMQKSAQKSAEVKADQPAALVEKAATAASSAAPSSAAPAKEAQSSATNDSAIKDAQSAAPAKADNAAAKDEQKAAPASNAAKDAQKADKASSAAQPAAKDSDAKSDADKKVDAPTDQIDTTDVTAGEDGQDLKDDAAAKAAGDVKDNSENKDVNNKKSVDKEKDAKDNNSVGDSPLGDGDLTINGSAVDGLTRNSDGTYSGDLDFHFDASSVDVALFADSNTVIQIPPELRDLFNKINESGNWTRYFNGRGRFKVYITVVPYVINWELSNSDFSFDGSNLILRNARIAAGVGRRELTIDFNFDLGKAVNDFKADIPDSSNYYHFKSALVDANSIIDWPIIGSAAGEASLSTNQLMPHPDAVDAPTNSIVEGDKTISGKGIPGATVNVSFADGTSIGSTIVDSNGNWTISTGHVDLKAGDEITAKQTVDGISSDEAHQTVKAKEDVTAPVINDIMEGDTVITGKGIPGATVDVTFADGTVIGSTMVDSNGNWSVSTSHVNLKAGDEVTAKQTVNGVTSDEVHQTVKANQEVTAPVIDDITEGDKTITGKGIPGATVNVTFIGTATVDADGNWSVNTSHVNLQAGDEITATQTIDGITSDPGSQTVKAKQEVTAPVINDITEGDRTITGTGIPGATVTVTFADGTPIGTATVDVNGNWSVNTAHVNLQAGDEITATQEINGVTSDPGSQTVKARQEVTAPVFNDVTEGDSVITGKGIPGAEVTVSFADGTPIGTAIVDSNGNWSISTGYVVLNAGDELTAKQTVNGVTSEESNTTVKAREEVTAPIFDDVTEGASVITGEGIPGATVTVTFADGTPIGTAKVDANGKWTVNASRVKLQAGDELTAKQTLNGVTSKESHTTVKAKEEVTAPEFNDVTEGDSVITGKGIPGAEVTVSFADGTVVGTATVDADGNWSVSTAHISLKAGDELTATQTINGITSKEGNTTVKAKVVVNAPDINKVTAGDRTISGTGKPGATVNVTLDDGTVIGTATVDADGNWTVNVPGAINLKEGNVVTATQTFDGVTSEKSNRPVDPKPVVEAPHINKITEGDPVITGTGIPGAEVTVTLADGTVIGTATVDKDGNWSVNVGDVELQSGKVVNAVRTVNGVTSKQDSRVVDPKREIDAPVIGHVKEGDRTIRGTGKPGATVDVTLDDGTVIGSATVNDEGTWSVNVPDGIELKEGNIINATQTFDGATSEKGQRTVDPREDVKAPVINPITEGDSEITGTGKPGATVTVSFDDGTGIGTATVDENGNWSISTSHINIQAGDKIEAYQTFNGTSSDKNSQIVKAQVNAPVIGAVDENSTKITGTGRPGATVNVYKDDGTGIGTATVDENGKWSVDVPAGVTLTAGDQVVATQIFDGVTSEEGSQTVKAVDVPAEITFNVGDEIDATQTLDGVTSDVSHTNVVPKAPSITPPEAGAKVIQGVGDPGATINVYAADGTLIGTTTVDDFGSWSIDVPAGIDLQDGDKITAVEIIDGYESDPTEVVVGGAN